MAPETFSIRLTVWRPARLNRRLVEPSNGQKLPAPFQEGYLLEEAYSWKTIEDFHGCLNPEDVGKIRGTLFQAFAAHLRASDRHVSKLLLVVADILKGCDNAKETAWKDVFTTSPEGEEPVNLRANSALALAHHLKWIHDVFIDVPGASVVVR